MDILDILLDILLKPPQPFIGLFFYFGFARITEVRHILKKIVLKSAHNEHLDTFMNTFASTFINILMGLFTL